MKYKFTLFILLLTTFMTFFFTKSFSQDLLKAGDLSKINVSQLSDADINKLKIQLLNSGMTIGQAEQIAISKGMSVSEFNKLKERLQQTTPKSNVNNKQNSNSQNSTTRQEYYNKQQDTTFSKRDIGSIPAINPLIFGSELYTSVAMSFEPNSRLATPVNYVLGPDDELQINIFGVQEYSGDLPISAEGNINVPNVGQIKLAGLTIEVATEKLKKVFENSVYPYLKTGAAKLSVSLNKIRSIKVTVIGSRLPGNYTVSSLSTLFNVLYLAGGPNEFGSFRKIELIRNNKVEKVVDLYKFLLNGNQSDNIGLKDNDVIRIPSYQKRVEVQGQVKRPGIFEVLDGESFSKVLEFTSGFTDTAYKASLKVYQRGDKDLSIKDLTYENFINYQPQSGDLFQVSRILNKFRNRVKINGAVFRPDVYELSQNLTLIELIKKADGLKEDAYLGRAQIIRYKDDLTKEILSVDLKKTLLNDPAHNLVLRNEDEVIISSVLNLKDQFKVTIQGEVRFPGEYDYVDNLSLRDLILQAGGFTDAASKNIEIARLIKRDSLNITDSRASSIINTEIDGDLGMNNSLSLVQPFDVITIRKKAGYYLPESVLISGEVQYPGSYAIGNRNEKVSDLLKRAGGFTANANPAAAYLRRFITEEERRKTETVRNIQKGLSTKDSVTIKNIDEKIQETHLQVPLDLVSIIKSPGSIEDLVLRPNDELVIPQFDGQIKVSGAVLLETQLPFKENARFIDYVNNAGGYGADAWRKKAYIVYANGKASTIKKILFFKSYPKIYPGSEIIVPKKSIKASLSTAEVIGISSAVASLAGVVIAILRL